jgi:hypothetical protein
MELSQKTIIIDCWGTSDLGLPYKRNQEFPISEMDTIIKKVLSRNLHIMIRTSQDTIYLYIDRGSFR